jgi:hypothetical protein
MKDGPKDSKFSQHTKIAMRESIPRDTANTMSNIKKERMPWMQPKPPLTSLVMDESSSRNVKPNIYVSRPLSSLVVDEGPSHIVGKKIRIRAPLSSLVLDKDPTQTLGQKIHIIPPSPSIIPSKNSCPPIIGSDFQELQNLKNMILILQLDFQEERSKRECLEEKLRKFEGYLTRQSHETPKRKWDLPDMRELDEKIPQKQSFLPTLDTIKDVDEKIRDLSSEFDLRLRSLDESLLEIRSILANNPVDFLKIDKKSLLDAGPNKDKDYNGFLYKKLERGVFPKQISLKNAIMKSVEELLHKPLSEKTEIEVIMDQYYLDNLPSILLQPDDKENEDRTPVETKESGHLLSIREHQR